MPVIMLTFQPMNTHTHLRTRPSFWFQLNVSKILWLHIARFCCCCVDILGNTVHQVCLRFFTKYRRLIGVMDLSAALWWCNISINRVLLALSCQVFVSRQLGIWVLHGSCPCTPPLLLGWSVVVLVTDLAGWSIDAVCILDCLEICCLIQTHTSFPFVYVCHWYYIF